VKRLCWALALGAGLAVAEASPPQGHELYLLYCSGCHGADGSGMPPNIPDLRSTMARIAGEPDIRHYALRVPGVSMSTASTEELVTIFNWMVPAFAPQLQRYPAFTRAEIGAARTEPLTDPFAVRAQLIQDSYTPTGPAASAVAPAPTLTP
jgi:mono/diheme cytochrome c family protein